MPAASVLIHVQHLLGIGHVKRAAAIAGAIAAEGLDVTLVSGGMPVPVDCGGARLVQLPPVRATDETFSGLVDATGRPIDDAFRASRRAQLLEIFQSMRPRVLMTEMFPFGRRQLHFELLPLVEAAHAATPRPLVLSSVRDILVEKRDPARSREMATLARRYYDRVLVHGDDALVPFGASFPLADTIADLIAYTGYVASGSSRPAPAGEGEGEIIVSAGGGAVGARLIEAAFGARAMGDPRARQLPWRVLVGASSGAAAFASWRARAGAGVIVEPARDDFPALLGRAALSVSQAGYNTTMDILAAGVRSVLVPFAAGQETEQSVRAAALARAGRAIVVPEAELTPERLAAAMARALDAPPPGPSRYRLDGAHATARLVAALVRA